MTEYATENTELRMGRGSSSSCPTLLSFQYHLQYSSMGHKPAALIMLTLFC